MKPDMWERLDSVFFKALELPPEERAAFLDQACGADTALRREVDAVLAAHVSAGGTQDPDRLLTVGEIPPGLPPGGRVGVYELEVVIGRGGMGEVYRARRADAQYEQQVAVKLMRPGGDTAELMRRFRTERQILARLQHPGIATLLDGGVTESGQPYLVMQYVDGAPITTWANERGLDLARRLRLFAAVCDAVHFAHANLVVHRDLKPSNILVTNDGEVRLLDFGIAKLLDIESADGPPTGDLLLLTPEHAAPEQFLGGHITTATDVYALGVLLYELLTGFRPFQFVPRVELHRAVCEQEPRAPSVAGADPAGRARTGQPRPSVTPEEIEGDLDAIALMALRKEPERRYSSAAELADDVRRHLNGFPVAARRETFGYVASRYLKRHKVGVLASAALAIALIALAIVSVRFAITSRAQARAIAVERDVALEVSSFLENLFKSPDPFAMGPSRRDTLRMRDFLTEGTRKARAELSSQPLVQARLLTVLGRAQMDLGRSDSALPVLEEAVAIRRRELGPTSSQTAMTERSLAAAWLELGKTATAESLFRSAAAVLARDSMRARGEWVMALGGLGNALQQQGRYPEAEATYREAMAVSEAGDSADQAGLPGRLSDLANALTRQAKYAEAESVLRRSVALERSAHGNDHPRVAIRLRGLAFLHSDRGEFEEAVRLNREALAIYRASLPPLHPRTASTMNNLASALAQSGNYTEAEALFREALAMQRSLFGDRHQAVGGTLANLASVIDDQGRKHEALQLKLEARDLLTAALGPGHPHVAVAHNNVGASLHDLGRHAEALESFEAALTIRRAKLPPGHLMTADAMVKGGKCLVDLRRYRDAELRLKEAWQALEPRRADAREEWDSLLEQMVRLYRGMGRSADAKRYAAMRTG